jgi:hypothetical protein
MLGCFTAATNIGSPAPLARNFSRSPGNRAFRDVPGLFPGSLATPCRAFPGFAGLFGNPDHPANPAGLLSRAFRCTRLWDMGVRASQQPCTSRAISVSAANRPPAVRLVSVRKGGSEPGFFGLFRVFYNAMSGHVRWGTVGLVGGTSGCVAGFQAGPVTGPGPSRASPMCAPDMANPHLAPTCSCRPAWVSGQHAAGSNCREGVRTSFSTHPMKSPGGLGTQAAPVPPRPPPPPHRRIPLAVGRCWQPNEISLPPSLLHDNRQVSSDDGKCFRVGRRCEPHS